MLNEEQRNWQEPRAIVYACWQNNRTEELHVFILKISTSNENPTETYPTLLHYDAKWDTGRVAKRIGEAQGKYKKWGP